MKSQFAHLDAGMHSNAAMLMLRDDVVQAVAAGRFAVHAVHTVDEALELFTGLPSGDASVPVEDTVNGRIAQRLREYSSLRRGEPRFGQRSARRVGMRGPRRATERGAP